MFLGRPHTCEEGTEMCWGSCLPNPSVFDDRLYNLTSEGDCVSYWSDGNNGVKNAWGFFHQSCCFSKNKNWFNLLQLRIKNLTEVFSLPLHEWFSLWMVYLWMVARKTSLLLAKAEVTGNKARLFCADWCLENPTFVSDGAVHIDCFEFVVRL